MAPKPNSLTITRETPRGDWKVTLPVASFGPKGKNDAEGQFVQIVDETAHVRFGGAGGAIIASTPAKEQVALVVASVREMRKATADGYENDARKGAIPSTVIALAAKAASSLTEGAAIRKRLRAVPASQRVEKAPGILADAS